MGTPTTNRRSSGIPRQGPVDLRRRQRASLEATAAAGAVLTAVLLALALQPDLTDVAIGMVLVGALLLAVAAPVRLLLDARAAASRRR